MSYRVACKFASSKICSCICVCICTLDATSRVQDALESVVDLREADVPFHVRFCIDRDIRCGHWYTVIAKVGTPELLSQFKVMAANIYAVFQTLQSLLSQFLCYRCNCLCFCTPWICLEQSWIEHSTQKQLTDVSPEANWAQEVLWPVIQSLTWTAAINQLQLRRLVLSKLHRLTSLTGWIFVHRKAELAWSTEQTC